MTVQIATLCGSLQPGSSNDAVLSALEDLLAASGVGVDRVDGLGSLPPFRPGTEPPAAAVVRWAERLAAADAVVIATPEYAAGPPGVLKNGLDWLVGLSSLYRKPVAVICAGSTGGAFTVEALVRTLSYQGALTVATVSIGAVRTKLGADGSIADAIVKDELAGLAERLVRAISADEATLLGLVDPVVRPHGVDPARFGLVAPPPGTGHAR